eukprot:CAMPEP_0185909562 /NCGR_PEP_ID=MMETSP0196C-20130402/13438_1 /TAXON_ID=2932 /ORGANISM="Alexandrium fundyense, Strain CCMP1719" /LENGTH=40 /DNA_ID= /DNA_START= /DNA_END= /DNA_ORIENTATION=
MGIDLVQNFEEIPQDGPVAMLMVMLTPSANILLGHVLPRV